MTASVFGASSAARSAAARATECTECEAESATERRSGQRRTEDHQESVSSVTFVSSACSVHSVHSVHSVVQETLPVSMEGWRASLFKFTRGLKFDCGMEGTDMAGIRPHVELWYREASAVLVDVPFSDVWAEVVTSWERARHRAFSDPLGLALETARRQGEVPPVPDLVGYDETDVALA
jgi:hypothetical protein